MASYFKYLCSLLCFPGEDLVPEPSYEGEASVEPPRGAGPLPLPYRGSRRHPAPGAQVPTLPPEPRHHAQLLTLGTAPPRDGPPPFHDARAATAHRTPTTIPVTPPPRVHVLTPGELPRHVSTRPHETDEVPHDVSNVLERETRQPL